MTYFKTKLVVQLEFTRVTKAVVLLKAAWKASLWQVDEASKRAILLKKDFPRMPANTFDAPRRPPSAEGTISPDAPKPEGPDDVRDDDGPEIEGDPRIVIKGALARKLRSDGCS
ncbi:hypothetical protein H257_07869 [Aphanomyces astaci]|uniref:Uncharacterized protein n=1 Tax=Aphanomyces astaci TaxID=112090 RepID=W4GJG3_APHAT|nr:hypothetical protein H257_07869 [Aphanomyces astaci]ETV79139.1 hypothetical protein H257_07869 [Aphanomyces astaci]|eukprot:XP_009831858.1 hypothetical protein H257_07869 [Aphanomyces astaci]